jgi:acetylornithine deacetylase/succinyl-diaminopimelate desuccinylase family protein
MNELTELARRLVSIDSGNPDLVPGGAGEQEIAEFVADWLRGARLEVETVQSACGRPSVVGVARGTGGGRSLMLNAHMDTVRVAEVERPFEARVEGGRLYGRRAYDMKGALAACMMAASEAGRLGLRGDVIVAAVADEEAASVGTRSVLERLKADAAVVPEFTGLEVCIAHKGFVWLEVEKKGKVAHGSRHEEGVDAIAKMGKVLVELENLDVALRSSPSHELLGSGSLHASTVTGGQELSSYPERCLLEMEWRTVPGESAHGATEGEVREILERLAAEDHDFAAEVRTTLVGDPFEVASEEPIVGLVRQRAAQASGREPGYTGSAGWMDAALLAAAGIPTVVYGPGGSGAHAAAEWVELDDLEVLRRVLLSTAQEFCA